MSLAELFANEEALRALYASALHDQKSTADAAAKAAQGAADAASSHGAAKDQLIAALNMPVE